MTAAFATSSPADPLRVIARTRTVMPSCLNCGSYYVDLVDARLSVDADMNGEVHSATGYEYRAVFVCTACGFVQSSADR